MDGVSRTVQFITDYGVTTLITAIFLYVIVRLVNVAIDYAKNKIKTRRHDEGLSLRESISTEIQITISNFLEKHNGDRIQVIEFSNSVVSVAYLPFKYMTCTYEAYDPSLQSTASKIDHVSTSLFTVFFDHMYNVDFCVFDISNHNKLVGGAMYDLMKSQNHNKCICSMLRSTTSQKNIGYVVMYKESIDQFDIDEITSLSDGLSALLSTLDKNK